MLCLRLKVTLYIERCVLLLLRNILLVAYAHVNIELKLLKSFPNRAQLLTNETLIKNIVYIMSNNNFNSAYIYLTI